MRVRLAQIEDIKQLVVLEQQHINDEVGNEQDALQGHHFGEEEFKVLVSKYWVVVAEKNQQIIGYVLAGGWEFFKHWPIYRAMVKRLPRIDAQVSERNSCQYGPIWVHPKHRGQGIFRALVREVSRCAALQYEYLVTFIAEDNQHSYLAHTSGANMQVLDFFTYHDRDYFLLSKRVNVL